MLLAQASCSLNLCNDYLLILLEYPRLFLLPSLHGSSHSLVEAGETILQGSIVGISLRYDIMYFFVFERPLGSYKRT